MLVFGLDTSYKQDRFFKTIAKKGLKCVLSREENSFIIIFSLILLPIEVNFILKKKSCKKDILIIYSFASIKIVFKLAAKVVAP